MASTCARCGSGIQHRKKASRKEREARIYCSKSCANRSHAVEPLYERMIEKTIPVPESGCLIFIGSWDGDGYGQVSTRRGSSPAKAHRVSYEHHHGPLPDGMQACHKCDTPACVRDDHLFAGTQADNMQDMVRKGRAPPSVSLNLRPGAPGFRGAGPKSKREIQDEQRS